MIAVVTWICEREASPGDANIEGELCGGICSEKKPTAVYRCAHWQLRQENIWIHCKSLLFGDYSEVNGHRPNEGYIGWGDKNSAEALGFTEECCGMSSMLLLALCFSRNAERKKLARILHELTIEFTQNMIKLFWVQQLCTASCLGRCAGSWEAAAMPRIFSSQLAINFGTFSPSNFSMIGSRKVLFGKIKRELVGWARHRGFIKLWQE